MSSKKIKVGGNKIFIALSLFLLIFLWLTSVNAFSISAEVDPIGLVPEINEENNIFTTTSEVISTGSIGITFVPVYLENKETYTRAVEKNLDFIKDTYPLQESNIVTRVIQDSRNLEINGMPLEGTNPYHLEVAGVLLWTEFRLSGNDLVPDQNPMYSDNVIVGIVPNGFMGGTAGRGSIIIRNTVLVEAGQKHIAAHEIGHVYELCEEYDPVPYWLEFGIFGGCGNTFPICHEIEIDEKTYCAGSSNTEGFWVSEEKEIQPYTKEYFDNEEVLEIIRTNALNNEAADCSEIENIGTTYKLTCTFYYHNFMGIPPYESEWVSKETYSYLQTVFENTSLLMVSLSGNENPTQTLLLSGLADRNGEITLQDLYIIDSVEEQYIPEGPYSLKLLDSEENVLLDQNFGISFTFLSNPPIDLNTTAFAFTVPFPDETHKIQIDFNGQTRAQRLVSANQPTVSFVSPNGGEEWSSTHLVEWNASDLDGDALRFVVQYSNDNGTTWNPITIGLNETSFELDTAILPPGEQYKLKVIVTDGVNTEQAISETFAIRNPKIEAEPWLINFEETEQGTILEYQISLQNSGNQNLEIQTIQTNPQTTYTGISTPTTLTPEQNIEFQMFFDTNNLQGEYDQNVLSIQSNDPKQEWKNIYLEGTITLPETADGNLHLTDMNSYIKEKEHYSGAATAKIILDYIRTSTGYSQLSQDKLQSYANLNKDQNNQNILEFDANAMDAVLGHYDPYDNIINDNYDSHDTKTDGNPYQGYNYTINTFQPEQMNEYMLDITH